MRSVFIIIAIIRSTFSYVVVIFPGENSLKTFFRKRTKTNGIATVKFSSGKLTIKKKTIYLYFYVTFT